MQQDHTAQPGISTTDQDFVQRAYDENQTEINLGQAAVQNASSDAVKNFAQNVVNDHQQANQQLQQIASDKGITLQSSQNATSDQSLATASGRDFDYQYLQQQKDALNNEVSLFQQEARNGQDPSLKSFAANRLSQLHNEVQMAGNLSSQDRRSVPSSAKKGGGYGKYGPENAYGTGTTSSYPSSAVNPDENKRPAMTAQNQPSSSETTTTQSSQTTTTQTPPASSESTSANPPANPPASSESTATNQSQSQQSQSNPGQTETQPAITGNEQTNTGEAQNVNQNLPRTGSDLPLFGLAGLLLIAAALTLKAYRLRSYNS